MRTSETKNQEVFKARAYAKVIRGIKAYPDPIKKLDDVKDIPGIGVKIRAKIEEIIKTNHLQAAEDVKESNKFFEEVTQCYGVGPSKAKALAAKVSSMEELRARAKELLNDKQQIGLRYYDEFLERIPREEMLKHNTYIKNVVQRIAGKGTYMHVVGSFRRGLPDSGDIDVLLCFPGETQKRQIELFKGVIAAMQKSSYITDVLAAGDHKCLGVCKLVRAKDGKHRRIDLLLTPESEYGYALLYFTGSQAFNIQCRIKAKEKGYSLSEHGLDPVGKTAPAPKMLEEKEILKFLGINFVQPSNR